MTTGQRPRRLGLSLPTRLRCRGAGGAGRRDWSRAQEGCRRGAVRSTWPLLWRSHPWGVDVASRRTFEDLVKMRRHPLGIVAVVVTVPSIILTRGFFFRLAPLPRFSSTRL